MELLDHIRNWNPQRSEYSSLPTTPIATTTSAGPSSTPGDSECSHPTGIAARHSLSRFFSDFTLGFADGLTVPFALTAGLSSLGQTNTVIYAGMAEICAGCISMGIGGYLAARPDNNEADRGSDDQENDQEKSTSSIPLHQDRGVADYIAPLQLPPDLLQSVMAHINSSPEIAARVIDSPCFARDEPKEEPTRTAPIISGLSVALGYLLGGSFPLAPYFFVARVTEGLVWSFAICIIALFIFGFTKEYVLHVNPTRYKYNPRTQASRLLQWNLVKPSLWEGGRMVVFGSIAAIAAVLCVRLFDGLVS
ncbi:Ccc1 family [Xylaria bambusicola]|uniref:Ccc1 family n=1 Tax=Xylaria bambusicola TaxID=326684 RepID=UPI0020080377|nr:Ccc1 family [Xylaria bambusicola]KAI0527963.1 Ccc1 family [Xylaria bambusicola]